MGAAVVGHEARNITDDADALKRACVEAVRLPEDVLSQVQQDATRSRSGVATAAVQRPA